MYICSVCSFAATKKRAWDRHFASLGHALKSDENEEMTAVLEESYEDMEDVTTNEDDPTHDTIPESALFDSLPPSPENDDASLHSDPSLGGDSWFPWKSRAHFYLTVLYHGSHRRNFDQTTLKVIMDMFKIYVPATEYFPTFKEVVNFKNEYWENKIVTTQENEGNVFTFLKPEGMIALRLSNPLHAHSFDRVPRRNVDGLLTSQSSAAKFSEFDYRKLGDLYVGDMVKLSRVDGITVPGQVEKVPCQMYFLIKEFFIIKSTYMAEGGLFFHSSLRQIRDQVDGDCYIRVKDVKESLRCDDLKLEQTLRYKNIKPTFCPFEYDEVARNMVMMNAQEFRNANAMLDVSLREGCVQVITNIHIDDASQVQSKVWKSASVFDIQIAGAKAGIKGNEHNNMILGLTDTATISLKRLFDGISAEFVRIGNEGFECYDAFTNKIDKVKLQVAAVLCDLPAKAEISPFKGFQADVFCPKDMYSKRTDTGLEIQRDLATVRRQIIEIQNERTQAGKKRLGVKFGLDINNLDSVLDTIDHFDMTQDMPQDILHHFILGWGKKSFIHFKNEILSDEALDQICQIFDQITWKQYCSRTNSNALRKAGSQIGRNIKALLQMVWYGVWVLIGSDPDRYRGDLEVFLRVFFYLGKLNYLFFNKHEVAWSAPVMNQLDDAIKTIVAIFHRDLEVLIPGPKTHDLEHHLQSDIARHGGPAGFDCQAGESKMKIQKLKNNYSNKHAPGKDVALKYLKTEIVRHIVQGGALNEDGQLRASENVQQETLKLTSVKSLLGIESPGVKVGQASLFDYETVNGKRKLKAEKPRFEHVMLGVPDQKMSTCDRIMTENGPVFRGSGLYVLDENGMQLGILINIYKSKTGTCFAIVEKLQDVSGEKGDNFLQEAGIMVLKRSNEFKVTSNLLKIQSVPLLHACKFEVPPTTKCEFVTGMMLVREERQFVQQTKSTYNCLGRMGNFFIINSTCLSLPTGVGLGCC